MSGEKIQYHTFSERIRSGSENTETMSSNLKSSGATNKIKKPRHTEISAKTRTV